MAIFIPGCPCPLCGNSIGDSDDVISTTFVGMQDERFRALDDAVFHRGCLETWKHRDDFINSWNENWTKSALDVYSKWRLYCFHGKVVTGFEMSFWQRLKMQLFDKKSA